MPSVVDQVLSRARSAGVGSASGVRPDDRLEVQAVAGEVAERVVADHDRVDARSRPARRRTPGRARQLVAHVGGVGGVLVGVVRVEVASSSATASATSAISSGSSQKCGSRSPVRVLARAWSRSGRNGSHTSATSSTSPRRSARRRRPRPGWKPSLVDAPGRPARRRRSRSIDSSRSCGSPPGWVRLVDRRSFARDAPGDLRQRVERGHHAVVPSSAGRSPAHAGGARRARSRRGPRATGARRRST